METAPVFVSLSTIPSRIDHLAPTLDSLFAQIRIPDAVLVCVPMHSTREDRPFTLPPFLSDSARGRWPPDKLRVVRCARDWGPATKVLGALPHLPEEAVLIAVDDDRRYAPFFVDELVRAQSADRASSFSFFCYEYFGMGVAQAADGFSFWAPNLRALPAFADRVLENRASFFVDDLWLSFFLQNSGIGVRTLRRADDAPCFEDVPSKDILPLWQDPAHPRSHAMLECALRLFRDFDPSPELRKRAPAWIDWCEIG